MLHCVNFCYVITFYNLLVDVISVKKISVGVNFRGCCNSCIYFKSRFLFKVIMETVDTYSYIAIYVAVWLCTLLYSCIHTYMYV